MDSTNLIRWTSTLAWQSGNAIGIFLVGSLIQCMIAVNDQSYGFPAWHCTLLAFAAMLIAYVGSVYGKCVSLEEKGEY